MDLHVKAEKQLIDFIKKDYPHWVESDGACPKCVDYYRVQMKKHEKV